MQRLPLSWGFVLATRLRMITAFRRSMGWSGARRCFSVSQPRLHPLHNKYMIYLKSSIEEAEEAAANGTQQILGTCLQKCWTASAPSARVSTRLGEGQGAVPANATALVKQLRERTCISIGLCKQALLATGWDAEEAVAYLRKTGVMRAAKAARRDAREGVVSVFNTNNGNSRSAVVLNCETDFVQRNPKFVAVSRALAEHCATLPLTEAGPLDDLGSTVMQLKRSQLSPKLSHWVQNVCTIRRLGEAAGSVEDLLADLTTQFGEKVDVSAMVRIEGTESSCVGAYVHGEIEPSVGRAAALVEIRFVLVDDRHAITSLRRRLAEFAKLLAMQIVATKPKFITVDSIPSSFVEAERALLEEAAAIKASACPSGARQADLSKVVEQRLQHCLYEQCLLQQEFLMIQQVHKRILGDGVDKVNSDNSTVCQQASLCRVKDAIQLVGRRLGCNLEVSRMRLLSVGDQ